MDSYVGISEKTNYTPKYSIGLIYLPTKMSFLEGRYLIPIHLWYIHLHLVNFYGKCMYMYGNIPYMDARGIDMPKKHET